MELEIIKAEQKDIYELDETWLKYNDNIYLIKRNGEKAGLIEYRIPYEYSLKVEYISINRHYTGQGIATAVINKLKEEHIGYEIYGDSLPNESAIAFWKSVGAEFEVEDSIEEHIENYNCIPFILH